MILSDKEKEERRKAVLILMARWEKTSETKEKARMLKEKNQFLKTRLASPLHR